MGHEGEANLFSIIINILIQIGNIVLFFFLFWKFFGKSIMKMIDDKIQQEATLKKADEEYALLIRKAQDESKNIIAQAHIIKDDLLQEGKQLGEQVRNEMIHATEIKIQAMEEQTKNRLQDMEKQLLSHFEESVKQVSFSLIKKIFHNNDDLQESYIKIITDEYTQGILKK